MKAFIEMKNSNSYFLTKHRSGGVGTFAIQLAKHWGTTVATTTSANDIELVKSLGADIVIERNPKN